MFVNENADLYRHLTFASVGGFFGAYAILCRSGILASAQTMNLLELTLNALRGDAVAVLLHLGALVLYVAGTMITVLLPHFSASICAVQRLLSTRLPVLRCASFRPMQTLSSRCTPYSLR